MSTTTTTAKGATGRPSPSPVRRIARLTRAEFILFVRYKTAWMFLAMPLMFLLVALQMPDTEVLPGVTSGELSMAGVLGSIGVLVGIGHASNVFAARRESLVLKRLRVSGVPPLVIFGALIAVITIFSLAVAVVIVGLVTVLLGDLPRDPLMLVVAVVLSAVSMSMAGLLVTPYVRNAEGAQMASVVPMMALMFTGGAFLPLDLMPDSLRQVMEFLPVAPAVQMAQAAYTGYDVFGGYEAAEATGYLGLWGAALPSVAVLLVWTVLLALLVRRVFRWDPRQP